MFFSDTLWLCDIEWWNACDLCMHVCLLYVIIFPVIESNEECAEEGEVFEYQEEEDQGLQSRQAI
jgi:Ca2+/Na+ antiporter